MVHESLFLNFNRFRQNNNSKPESGGILLGLRRGTHMEISLATSPFKEDVQSRYRFFRKDQQHEQVARENWKKSNGYIDYLGEWHTHPENIPEPSSIDIAGWKTKARQNKHGFFLGIIIGITGIWVGLITDEDMFQLKKIED